MDAEELLCNSRLYRFARSNVLQSHFTDRRDPQVGIIITRSHPLLQISRAPADDWIGWKNAEGRYITHLRSF